ncbi:MAG: hypothetical protein A3F72_08925 [Bacteroidetes bacterium RIFCSPLOWO2_12_FULL_35_15]|nr:MAG: hypothetical protein A3F72_08925 [Bacteroidetes bacterium RIFCSPLOWO2_12_FULL_35_15]
MHLIDTDLPVKFLHPQIMKLFFKKKSDRGKYGLVLLDVIIVLIILILIGLIMYAIDKFSGV